MATERDQFSEFDEPGFVQQEPDEAATDREQMANLTGEPMIPKSRFDEVRQERDHYASKYDETVRTMLNRPAPAMQQAPQEPQLPPGTDKEVFEAVDPVVRAMFQQEVPRLREEIRQEIAGRYGHVLSRVERDMNLNELDERVPGFKSELYSDVKAMWDEMPPERRREYDSKAGMEALALKARLRRLEQSPGADLSGMAHSAYGHPADARSGSGLQTENDIWNLSPDEFRRRYPAGG